MGLGGLGGKEREALVESDWGKEVDGYYESGTE